MRNAALLLATVLAAGCAKDEAGSTVIYLNRGGASIVAGDDDAARGSSSLVSGPATIASTTMSDTAWNQVVACVQRAYAPFAVEIVDSRPAHDDFSMVVFGGDSSELGRGEDQHGIAPFDRDSCETIDNAIVFVFTDNLADDVAQACDVAVHELAHTFGIDHQLLASAPTSYLAFSGARHFQNVDAQCGEDTARACACGGATQNSFEILSDRLGLTADADVDAPEVAITATTGARGALQVRVHAEDGSGISAVVLHYTDAGGMSVQSTCGDGRLVCTSFNGDHTFTVIGTSGHAVFHAEVTDTFGNLATSASIERDM